MRLLAPITWIALAACAADTYSPSATYTLDIVTGSVAAHVAPGEEIATLHLRVLDDRGQPVVGREVALDIREGGGLASLTPDHSGVDGLMILRWTAGTGIGPQRIRLTPLGGETSSFTSEATGFQAARLSVGHFNACAIDFDARAWCWGDGLSDGAARGDSGIDVLPDWRPIPVSGGHHFQEISAGGDFTCALDLTGAAWCWGYDQSGQLGQGTEATGRCFTTIPCQRYPVLVTGGQSFTQIATAAFTACAVDGEKQVWCWGEHRNGQVGIGLGSPAVVRTPILVSVSDSVVDLVAGYRSFCARLATGVVECWGAISAGQVSGAISWTPTAIPTAERFVKLFAAAVGVCGRNAASETYCWGSVGGVSGPVVRRPELDRYSVLGGDWLSTGWGLDATGHLNWFYQGASGDVSGGMRLTSLSSGGEAGCGFGAGNQVWCWGSNSEGELGNPYAFDAFDHYTYPPVPVGGWYPLP